MPGLPKVPADVSRHRAEPSTLSMAKPETNGTDTLRNKAEAEPADPGAPAATAQPGSGFSIDLALRQARRMAHESGKEEAGRLTDADTQWTRFQQKLDAAHVESATGVHQDSYVSADGTVIYRKRVGNRTLCRKSGSVGGEGIAGAGGVNGAGWISCPRNADWKREP